MDSNGTLAHLGLVVTGAPLLLFIRSITPLTEALENRVSAIKLPVEKALVVEDRRVGVVNGHMPSSSPWRAKLVNHTITVRFGDMKLMDVRSDPLAPTNPHNIAPPSDQATNHAKRRLHPVQLG